MWEEEKLYRNYLYLVYFDTYSGYRCGYVKLLENHPFYKKYFDELHIDCHGGLSFSGHLKDRPTEDWYIGFDCGHLHDGFDSDSLKKYLSKELAEETINRLSNYKDPYLRAIPLDECIDDCHHIIDQLIMYEK